MSGVHFTTISPSSTSSRRNTPCVEGCCGPIEIVIWVSSGRSTTSDCGGLSTAALIRNRSYRSHTSHFTQGYTAHTLATENLCAERDPASHPAKECGANPDERQRSRQKDRTSRARASLRCAKLRLQSARARRLRSAG